jgi:hypothetical protein
MWVFTRRGFVSIVASETSPQFLLVRSRFEGHIEALFPAAHVSETPSVDYPFRALVSKSVVTQKLAALVAEIDYGNFNDAVKDSRYHDACLDVSSILKLYEDRPQPHPSDEFMP